MVARDDVDHSSDTDTSTLSSESDSHDEHEGHLRVDRSQAVTGEMFSHPHPQVVPMTASDWVVNQNEQALVRFPNHHTTVPPNFTLFIQGIHIETRERVKKTKDKDGKSIRRKTRHKKTITDFSYQIDLTSNLLPEAVQWSTPDSTPAWRGGAAVEIDVAMPVWTDDLGLQTARVPATSGEIHAMNAVSQQRRRHNAHPWLDLTSEHPDASPVLASSRPLQAWAREYFESKEVLKEFTFTKVVHGWDIPALTSALEATIRLTGYAGQTDISFTASNNEVIIRPNNWLSRAREWPLLGPLVEAIIYLLRSCGSVGGKWSICGAAYALRCGDKGEKEGEWMRRWENTVRYAIVTGLKMSKPLVSPVIGMDGTPAAVSALDGYEVPVL